MITMSRRNAARWVVICPTGTPVSQNSHSNNFLFDAQGLTASSKIRLILDDSEKVDFQWGEYYVIGSPAYWIDQAKKLPSEVVFSESRCLAEDVVFCLLGGHGISAELNIAAYYKVRDAGLISINRVPSKREIEHVLRSPMELNGREKPVKYRFPTQKSQRIHNALKMLSLEPSPQAPLDLREWLLKIPGIGLKTASWIVRNHLSSGDVAIIDIHIQRAGVAAGFFKEGWKLPRDYRLFERAFIGYALMGDVSPAVLDICIWKQMRTLGRHAQTLLPQRKRDQNVFPIN